MCRFYVRGANQKKTDNSSGKIQGFCLDDFLEQGLKFNPNEDLFGTGESKPKEKKKDRDSARNERKAAREAKKKKNKANKSRGEGLSLDDLLASDPAAPLHDEQLDNLFGSSEFGNKEESSKMESNRIRWSAITKSYSRTFSYSRHYWFCHCNCHFRRHYS